MSNSRQIASLPNILTLIDDAGGQFIKQQAAGVTTSYTITWPSALGASGSVLGFTDGSGSLGWLTSAPKATILNTGRDFTFTGDATGSISGFDGSANVSTALTLAASGVSAGSYGGSTAIPVITVDAKGRITSASTAAISSSLTIAADSGSNDTVTIGSDTLTFAGTSNEVDTTVSNNQIQIGLPNDVTISNDLTVSGDLVVTGTTTQTGAVVSDSNFTGLSDANSGNATDFGFYGKYVESATTKYAGLFYDASTDNTFRLFADTQTVPSTTVNTGATGYAAANLVAGTVTATTFSGDLSGTVNTATTGTTQAASDNSTKLATTAYVTTAVSNLVDSAPGALNTLNELAAALGDDANFSTTVTNSIATKLPLAGGTLTGNVIFNDNVKALFGTGSDLEIYHDGSNSYLVDAGTGGILYRGGTQTFQNAAGSKTMAVLNGATSVDLYYDNSKKFETTSGGIAVTGTATATTFSATTLTGTLSTAAQTNITSVGTLSSLTVSGALNATLATAAQTNITSVGTLTSLNVNGTATATAFSGPLTGNVTGNVSGSAATVTGAAQTAITSVGTLSALTVSGDVTVDTNTLKVDSSNNRVGILNASPDVTLDIGSATDSIHIPVGTTAQRPGSPAAGYFRYNSSLNQFEGYTSAWGAIGGGGTNTFTHNVFTGDGSTTAFALSAATESENNLLVFIDGVFQEQGAYSIATSGGTTTLTMSAAPASGRKLVVYQVSAAVSGSNLNIDTMTGDGSDTTLTLSIAPVNENNTQVFFDGVYQNKSTYSISGTTLTFSTAPPSGVAVEVMTFTQTEVNVPVNDTIDTVHIKAGAVTAAKIESSLDLSSKSLTLPAVAVPSASTATTQAASDNTTKIATTAYVTTAIANLIDGAPGTLNTLNELAAALADDASFSSTITTNLAAKANLAAPNFTGNVTFDSTTLTVDATNNRVGIGTASPATPLDVTGAAKVSGNITIGEDAATTTMAKNFTTGHASGNRAKNARYGMTDSTFTGMEIVNAAAANSSFNAQSINFITHEGAVSVGTRMTIDSNGTVGIGTTDIHTWATFDGRLRVGARGFFGTTTASTQMGYNWYYDGAYKYIAADTANRYYQNGGNHIWETAASGSADGTITWSEMMRIDSSGDLLVGTTSTALNTSNSVSGHNLFEHGYAVHSRDGQTVMSLNRLSSDGTVVDFRYEGSTVGQVATRSSGGNLQIYTNQSGIDFGGDGYLPMRGGTITNNSVDLGSSSFKYKDLFLSGAADVAGRIKPGEHIIFSTTTGYLQFPAASSRAWVIASHGGTAAPGTSSATFGFHHWSGSAWSNPVNISASGKVGIGTSNPDNSLHIKNGSAGFGWTVDTGDNFIMEANTSAIMNIITPTGNNGVVMFSDADARGRGQINYSHTGDDMYIMTAGTTSLHLPSNKYLVAQGASQVRLVLGSQGNANNNSSNWIRGSGTEMDINTAGGDFNIEIAGSKKLTLNGNNLNLVGGGYVAASGGFWFYNDTDTGMYRDDTDSISFRVGGNDYFTIDGDATTYTHKFNSGTYSWYVGTSGNTFNFYDGGGTRRGHVHPGNGFVNGSDRAYKENISDITYGLETVKKLQPRKFKFKDTVDMADDSVTYVGDESVGFIAQELETAIPELVMGEDGTKTVAYSQLTAVLTKAIQEQQVLIEALQAEVAALKGE